LGCPVRQPATRGGWLGRAVAPQRRGETPALPGGAGASDRGPGADHGPGQTGSRATWQWHRHKRGPLTWKTVGTYEGKGNQRRAGVRLRHRRITKHTFWLNLRSPAGHLKRTTGTLTTGTMRPLRFRYAESVIERQETRQWPGPYQPFTRCCRDTKRDHPFPPRRSRPGGLSGRGPLDMFEFI